MQGRHNQFRLQHWQLAERQRYLADLESLIARLRADVESLDQQIESAGQSDQSDDMNPLTLAWLDPLHERRDKLTRTIAEVDEQLVAARGAVASAQQEVRLVEGSAAYRGFTFEDRRHRRSRRPG
jgi:chromosome segregation ATPase